MKKLPSIWETERMKMQEITEADTDFIVELRSNPEAYRYFLAPHPLQKQEHIFWYRDRYLNDDFQSSYIARSKSEKTSLGVFSVKQTEAGEIEISYILAPNAQGKGLATEAVQGLECLCKKYTDVAVFTAQIHICNTQSIRLINRLGYVQKERIGDFILYQKEIQREP